MYHVQGYQASWPWCIVQARHTTFSLVTPKRRPPRGWEGDWLTSVGYIVVYGGDKVSGSFRQLVNLRDSEDGGGWGGFGYTYTGDLISLLEVGEHNEEQLHSLILENDCRISFSQREIWQVKDQFQFQFQSERDLASVGSVSVSVSERSGKWSLE